MSMEAVQRIPFARQSFRPVIQADLEFITNLFKYEDVRNNYVRHPDHELNNLKFVKFLIEHHQNEGLYFIIEDNDNNKVGIITAEFRDSFDTPTCELAFAVHPYYRKRGHASSAVMNLLSMLKHSQLKQAYMDFSQENIAAERIAKKCGFSKLCATMNDLHQFGGAGDIFVSPIAKYSGGGLVAFYDDDNPEAKERFGWIRPIQISSRRDQLGDQAIMAHRQKDYHTAIMLINEALSIPYTPGSVHDDGILMGNLGMAYSSVGAYKKAYECLKQACSLGVNNPTVLKEIRWLEENRGYCL